MLNRLVLILLILFSNTSYSQVNRKASIEKWKKATIHLELKTDTLSRSEKSAHNKKVWEAYEGGEISEEERSKQTIYVGKYDISKVGTAIFFRHKEKFYLLSARHVLEDKIGSKAIEKDNKKRQSEEGKLYDFIIKVPTLDEFLKDTYKEFVLYGIHSCDTCYLFSNELTDLAILSLNEWNTINFRKALLKAGYTPISLNDIQIELSSTGTEVFTIGYPFVNSTLGGVPKLHLLNFLNPSIFSLPVYSHGYISMAHENMYYYLVNLDVYPGNSGGPIINIENGKLIGIVSSQNLINNTDSLGKEIESRSRIPYAHIIRSNQILALVDSFISLK